MSWVYYFMDKAVERAQYQLKREQGHYKWLEQNGPGPQSGENATTTSQQDILGFLYLSKIVALCNDFALWCDRVELALERNEQHLRPRFIRQTDSMFSQVLEIDNDDGIEALAGKQLCRWESFMTKLLPSLLLTAETKTWVGGRFEQAQRELRRGLIQGYDGANRDQRPQLKTIRRRKSVMPQPPPNVPNTTNTMAELVEKIRVWYNTEFQSDLSARGDRQTKLTSPSLASDLFGTPLPDRTLEG